MRRTADLNVDIVRAWHAHEPCLELWANATLAILLYRISDSKNRQSLYNCQVDVRFGQLASEANPLAKPKGMWIRFW